MSKQVKQYSAGFTPVKHKVAIVAARFNHTITSSLVNGAIDTLQRFGIPAENIEVFWVPGAFEIPLACKRILAAGRADGIVAIGAVIRGDTPHFDYVAGECASGIAKVSLEYAKPVSFGVLTTNTTEQAMDRAGLKAGNKGADAAMGLLEMLQLFADSQI